MPSRGVDRRDIGTPHYYELLHREAEFWERSASGAIDNSVATWRDADLSNAVSGDLLATGLGLVVARGRRVLELGCADGALGMRLARLGCVVDGMDISLGLIHRGQEQARELRARENWTGDVRLFVGDLNRLGLAHDNYDVVLATAVLHHVLDPDYLITSLFKFLKPGGTLVCLDHMSVSLTSLALRYLLLFVLPTEVPYRRKLRHAFNRLMARVYWRMPRRVAPAAFQLPERSPFEDITGSEVITIIRRQFVMERFQTYLAFADVVAGHLRFKRPARNIAVASRLRQMDDWLIRHLALRGATYFLVAHKPDP